MLVRAGILQLIQMMCGYFTLLIIVSSLSSPQYLSFALCFSVISLGIGYDFGLTHKINSCLASCKNNEIGHAINYWSFISLVTVATIIFTIGDITVNLTVFLIFFGLTLPIGKATDHALTQHNLFGLRSAIISFLFLLTVIIQSIIYKSNDDLYLSYLEAYLASASVGTFLVLIIPQIRSVLLMFIKSWLHLQEKKFSSIDYLLSNRWHAVNSLVGYLTPPIIIFIFSRGAHQETFGYILIAFNLTEKIFRLVWAITDACSINIEFNKPISSQDKYNKVLILIPVLGFAIGFFIFVVSNFSFVNDIWPLNIFHNIAQHKSFYWQALLGSMLYAISHHLGVYLIFKFGDNFVGKLTLSELVLTTILALAVQANLVDVFFWPTLIVVGVILIHLIPLALRLRIQELRQGFK